MLVHASLAFWLFHVTTSALIHAPLAPLVPAAQPVPPVMHAALERARKASIEIAVRRREIAAVHKRIVNAAPRRPVRPPSDPVAAAAQAVREAAQDFEEIRAAKMASDGGVPLETARELAGGDPLAQAARQAAQSGDIYDMLLRMRDMSQAAHFLPSSPTGITAGAVSDGNIQQVREIAPGQAEDLLGTGPPGPPTIASGPNFAVTQPVAGRKVAIGGEHADWMYVDSWYCIGPFPNPNRADINTVFEPEKLVNLDATYTGKNDRQVTWQFLQSPQPNIIPIDAEEYAIWYLYTELNFDHPCDLWVAMGSDDQSKIWLNGTKIWQSADYLKGWKIDEGFRRVHFNKGVNRVLARLENGWLGTAISLCVKVGD